MSSCVRSECYFSFVCSPTLHSVATIVLKCLYLQDTEVAGCNVHVRGALHFDVPSILEQYPPKRVRSRCLCAAVGEAWSKASGTARN